MLIWKSAGSLKVKINTSLVSAGEYSSQSECFMSPGSTALSFTLYSAFEGHLTAKRARFKFFKHNLKSKDIAVE